MHDDQHETEAPRDPQGDRAEWIAPALTDLGSFDELTNAGAGSGLDFESTS